MAETPRDDIMASHEANYAKRQARKKAPQVGRGAQQLDDAGAGLDGQTGPNCPPGWPRGFAASLGQACARHGPTHLLEP